MQEPLVARAQHRSLGVNGQAPEAMQKGTTVSQYLVAILILLVVGLGVSTVVLASLYGNALQRSPPPPPPPPSPFVFEPQPSPEPAYFGRKLYEDTEQVFKNE